MGQSTYYSSHLETVDSRSLPSVYLSAPLSTVPTGSNLTLGAITKKKVSCYPLMTFIGVKSAVLFTPSRVLRTRRNDYKLRSNRRSYSRHCPPTKSAHQTLSPHSTDNSQKSHFPSTPSEYAAYRTALNASSMNTPSTQAPCTIPKQPMPQAFSYIPPLSLSLGLCRIPSSPPPPSVIATPNSVSSSRSTKRRSVSKSDVAEARWRIKMYESLDWHSKQFRCQTTYHDRVFLDRLETQVRCRWYPIVGRSQPQTTSESQVLHEEHTTIAPLTSADVPVGESNICSPPRMLDPTQLAAQVILRRSHASGKPLRRRRHTSPGHSALRREVPLIP